METEKTRRNKDVRQKQKEHKKHKGKIETADVISCVTGLPQRAVYRNSRGISKRWNETALRNFQCRKYKIKKDCIMNIKIKKRKKARGEVLNETQGRHRENTVIWLDKLVFYVTTC